MDMDMALPMDQTGLTLTSPTLLYSAISPTVTVATESSFGASPLKNEDGFTDEPPKKKQKRNKPTLSCEECVERKTKVSQQSIIPVAAKQILPFEKCLLSCLINTNLMDFYDRSHLQLRAWLFRSLF
jgi:hypothetical protein